MPRARGFSLVELIIVIILIGIVSVYVATRSGGDPSVRKAAQELVEAIRYAQQRSMSSTGSTAAHEIAITNRGFRVTQGATDVIDPRTGKAPYTDDDWAGKGITASGGIGIRFTARGEPLNAATGQPIGVTDIVISGGGKRATVRIQPVTGYARVL